MQASAVRDLAPMRGEFVDVGGTRLYYFAAGTRGGGDPLVLLHGFPGSAHSWRILSPLMPEGRRLVLVDLAGCGRSDGPGADGRTIAGHARLIRGLMDDLAITRAGLVGHGIGATIALQVALDDPARVACVATLAPVAFDAWPRSLGRLARASSPAAGLLGATVLASFLHGSALRGYVDRELGRRSLDQSLRAYGTRLTVGSILSHLALVRDPAIGALSLRLPEIAAPVAVICGADDPFLPAALGERVRAAIPGATLHVIPDARHFLAEDVPERCAEAIRELLNRQL